MEIFLCCKGREDLDQFDFKDILILTDRKRFRRLFDVRNL